MTCTKCGAYVVPGVRFCSNCGTAVDSETTQVARRDPTNIQAPLSTDVERTVFRVKPTLIFIKVGYALAVLGAMAVVALLAWLGVPAYISIPLALALLLIPAYYHVRRSMIRYTVTDAKLEIDTGFIARTTRNIPLSKIQDVTVQASIPQRIGLLRPARYWVRARSFRLSLPSLRAAPSVRDRTSSEASG